MSYRNKFATSSTNFTLGLNTGFSPAILVFQFPDFCSNIFQKTIIRNVMLT